MSKIKNWKRGKVFFNNIMLWENTVHDKTINLDTRRALVDRSRPAIMVSKRNDDDWTVTKWLLNEGNGKVIRSANTKHQAIEFAIKYMNAHPKG